MELFKYKNYYPQISEQAYIQDGVKICGNVVIEEEVSVWYNSTLRADIAAIHLKKGCNVQELTSIHVDWDFPTIIGERTTIGHNCIIHGATIGDDCLIGMGSTILNGAKLGNFCLVGAGSLVTQNSEFEDYSLIMGVPAKVVRPLKEKEIEYIKTNAQEYIELSREYLEGFE